MKGVPSFVVESMTRRDLSSVRGDFWAKSVEILVFPIPIGYMLVYFSFFLLICEYSIDSSRMMGNFFQVLKFKWLFLKLMPRSHQMFYPVAPMILLGIMLRNRCKSTTFHTIITEDADKQCFNWPV